MYFLNTFQGISFHICIFLSGFCPFLTFLWGMVSSHMQLSGLFRPNFFHVLLFLSYDAVSCTFVARHFFFTFVVWPLIPAGSLIGALSACASFAHLFFDFYLVVSVLSERSTLANAFLTPAFVASKFVAWFAKFWVAQAIVNEQANS